MLVEMALAAVLAGGPKPPCSDVPWRRSAEHRVELIRCLSKRFPKVSYSTALSVSACESGQTRDPNAVLGTSSGMWQHQMPYWRARALKYLTPRWGLNAKTASPFNAYAATIVTFSMVSDDDIGWGPWSCYR